eukprot:5252890-Amphidinium_carterae.1
MLFLFVHSFLSCAFKSYANWLGGRNPRNHKSAQLTQQNVSMFNQIGDDVCQGQACWAML